VHVHDIAQLLGRPRKLLLLRFHDYVGVGHVRHLDERTFQMEACGMNLRIATPNDQRSVGVNVKFQPYVEGTTVS
jgi:hypothetical protein